MNQQKANLWGWLVKKSRELSQVLIIFVPLCSFILYLFEDRIINFVSDKYNLTPNRLGVQCVDIPNNFLHSAESVKIGEWGKLTWVSINKIRGDCGLPRIKGIIKNGGNIIHDVVLSTTGIDLKPGIQSVTYLFKIEDEAVEKGNAQIQITISFPNGPTTTTPWVPFRILDD